MIISGRLGNVVLKKDFLKKKVKSGLDLKMSTY